MIQWRRELHRIPEIGLDLPKTSAFVQSRLTEMGIPYERKVNGSCVVGLLGKQGPCILLRADMDALPFAEESGEDFASSNGNMHACGHMARHRYPQSADLQFISKEKADTVLRLRCVSTRSLREFRSIWHCRN